MEGKNWRLACSDQARLSRLQGEWVSRTAHQLQPNCSHLPREGCRGTINRRFSINAAAAALIIAPNSEDCN